MTKSLEILGVEYIHLDFVLEPNSWILKKSKVYRRYILIF